MNIFLRYEITARELDANILTGLVAASRGHRAIVCEWPMMMRGILLRRGQPGFVHMNSLTPSKSQLIAHRIFRFFGYGISSMDQEAGIQGTSYESFAKIRFGEKSVAGVDLIFCWGRDDHDTLQLLYPGHKEKIVLTGSPRVDLWRPQFSSVYAKSKQTPAPFVVILSSTFGPLSPIPLHEELIMLRSSGYLARNPEMESEMVTQVFGWYKEGTDLMFAYLDLVRFLSLNHQELGIVVKPHPLENPEIWREILSGISRVRVDTETPTSQLIRESVAAITSGSTTAFEAQLSETPLISFQPVETPHRSFGFADSLGTIAKTAEEVHAIVGHILRARHQKWSTALPKNANVDVRRKVYYEDKQLAAERMVNSWERALSRGSQRSVAGSIFSIPREELKYFLAFAFPILIPFFVRERRISRPDGPQKKRKRPPLNRKLVEARLADMRSILGLQDSVSFRFRGRGGLILEPSDKSQLSN